MCYPFSEVNLMNSKALLFILNRTNLYGQSFDGVKKLLAKKMKKSPKVIEEMLDELVESGDVLVVDGRIREKEYSLHKDKVEPIMLDSILEQENKTSLKELGTVCFENGQYLFRPARSNIGDIVLTKSADVADAVGKRVCCQIKQTDKGYKAKIEQVFGIVDDPINEIKAIAYKYGFTTVFPSQVMEEVESIPQEVTKRDLAGRADMRSLFFMPWDPATAKDKDDAIYAEKTNNGYKVYVAIADVSRYVKLDGSALGKEAFKRGTSGYFGSGVYPMLPPELSNGICSLTAGADRLALVSVIDIDNKGNILGYEFKKAVINIKRAFCYEEAEKIHLSQDNFDKKYASEKPLVDLLYEIADVLEDKLIARGKIDFTGKEPEYTFNEDKNEIESVKVGNQERSHAVVEEFMILANEATAKFFKDNHLDGIYRIHERPNELSLRELNRALSMFGINYNLSANNKDYQTLLDRIKDLPNRDFLEDLILKTMMKAEYSSVNMGHFGLASSGYTHFTSPIRRFSDLVAHTIISSFLQKKKSNINANSIEAISTHLNAREKAEAKAEKQSNYFLDCLWAEKHQNETIEAVVYNFKGESVVLKYNTVELLLPLSQIGESFIEKNNGFTLIERTTKQKISVGDKIKIRIDKIDKNRREIFVCSDKEEIEKNEKSA